jgi:hypothetical protein
MKKLQNILGLIFLSIVLFSCEEEPIIIVKQIPPLSDTSFINPNPSSPQNKTVLFEDLTGVRCPNCPIGHTAIKEMQNANPGKVVAVAIHPGKFEFPQSFPLDGEPDFNTEFGLRIMDIVGKPNGLPYGMADRMENSVVVANWQNNAAKRWNLPTPVNINLEFISYNQLDSIVRFKLRIEFTEELPNEPIFFSTVITEDNIISKQDSLFDVVKYYKHNHVLRNMPQFSQQLNPGNQPNLVKGLTFIKEYETKLAAGWNWKNCNIVAFVHKNIEVLQAAEVKIK